MSKFLDVVRAIAGASSPGQPSKAGTAAVYAAPTAAGTLASYAAYRLGVPLDVVLTGATLLGQVFHAVASKVQRRRKARAAVSPSTQKVLR